MFMQRAIQEWATTGKKVHIIADKPEKRLAGMWRTAVDRVSTMVGNQLTHEVGWLLQLQKVRHSSVPNPAQPFSGWFSAILCRCGSLKLFAGLNDPSSWFVM